MCRLLAIYGDVAGWAEIALEFSSLAELGMVPPICTEPGHKDGWGMARSSDDATTMMEMARHLGSAGDSDQYRKGILALKAQPHVFICHLRKASPGIAVTIGNVHPFFHQGWAFIHNGTIYDHDRIPRNTAFRMTSDGSDSEYLFSYLLTSLQGATGSDRLKALSQVMPALRLDYTSLNCILSDGNELFAIRDYMRFGDYLSLYHYRLPKGVIICSEPITAKGLQKKNWQMMPNKSILRIYGTPPSIELVEYPS